MKYGEGCLDDAGRALANDDSQATPASGLKTAGEHFFWLDWLRFGAALAVVVCHARGSTWIAWGQLESPSRTKLSAICFALTRPGLEAVILFFALSGFLVGGRLIGRWRDDRLDLKRYWIDRASRIYTPLLPALAFTGVIALLQGAGWSWIDFGGNLLGLQGLFCSDFGGNAPLWSLSYEIWFYLLAGCAVKVATHKGFLQIVPWVVLAFAFAVFTRLNAAYLSCWVMGAIAYLALGKKYRWPSIIGAVFLIILGIVLSQLTSDTKSFATGGVRAWVPSRDVAIIILSAGIAILLPFLSGARPARQFIPFEHLGSSLAAFSYTLYLIHYPLVQLLSRYSHGPFSAIDPVSQFWFYGKVVASLGAAWLLYLPFEAQTARVRGWLTRRCS